MKKTNTTIKIILTIIIALAIVSVIYLIGALINPPECNIPIHYNGGTSTQICDKGDVIFEHVSILGIGFISSLFILFGLFLIWALFYFSWEITKFLINLWR